MLESQWKELEATFTPDRIGAHDLAGRDVFVVCYAGDTARVAASVLRARGIAAFSVKGGHAALLGQLTQLRGDEQRGVGLQMQGWGGASDLQGRGLGVESLRGSSEVVVGPP